MKVVVEHRSYIGIIVVTTLRTSDGLFPSKLTLPSSNTSCPTTTSPYSSILNLPKPLSNDFHFVPSTSANDARSTLKPRFNFPLIKVNSKRKSDSKRLSSTDSFSSSATDIVARARSLTQKNMSLLIALILLVVGPFGEALEIAMKNVSSFQFWIDYSGIAAFFIFVFGGLWFVSEHAERWEREWKSTTNERRSVVEDVSAETTVPPDGAT